MELDNVVPIDADTAQLLARRRVHFRWFVALLAATYLGVLVPTLLFTPLPPLGPFVMLAILVILAEHRFVLFGDETSMSASIIVVVASVFVFADSSPIAGPLLIGSLGGLYLPHIRRGSLTLMVANASSLGLSAAVAAAIASGTVQGGTPGTVLGASASVVVYWYTNSVLIGSASAVRQGLMLSESVRTQATSEWQIVILAIASAVAVIAATPHFPGELVSVTIALLAFEIRLRQEQREARFHRNSPWRVATVIGLAAAVSQTGSLGAAIALLGIFLVFSNGGLRRGSTTAPILSVVTAVLAASLIECVGAGIGVAFVIATLVALSSATGVQVLGDGRRAGFRLPLVVTFGLLLPSLSEAAMVSFAAVLVGALSHEATGGPAGLALAGILLLLSSATGFQQPAGATRSRFSGRKSSQVASR